MNTVNGEFGRTAQSFAARSRSTWGHLDATHSVTPTCMW